MNVVIHVGRNLPLSQCEYKVLMYEAQYKQYRRLWIDEIDPKRKEIYKKQMQEAKISAAWWQIQIDDWKRRKKKRKK